MVSGEGLEVPVAVVLRNLLDNSHIPLRNLDIPLDALIVPIGKPSRVRTLPLASVPIFISPPPDATRSPIRINHPSLTTAIPAPGNTATSVQLENGGLARVIVALTDTPVGEGVELGGVSPPCGPGSTAHAPGVVAMEVVADTADCAGKAAVGDILGSTTCGDHEDGENDCGENLSEMHDVRVGALVIEHSSVLE